VVGGGGGGGGGAGGGGGLWGKRGGSQGKEKDISLCEPKFSKFGLNSVSITSGMREIWRERYEITIMTGLVYFLRSLWERAQKTSQNSLKRKKKNHYPTGRKKGKNFTDRPGVAGDWSGQCLNVF